jgi:two-component system cell cycle response regulator
VLEEATDPQLELERNRVVVQLAGAVAHKLKQPLAVAWGYLELLLDDPNLDLAPSTVRYLREIQDSLRTMDDVINKLQQATTAQTRPYGGSLEILDLDGDGSTH